MELLELLELAACVELLDELLELLDELSELLDELFELLLLTLVVRASVELLDCELLEELLLELFELLLLELLEESLLLEELSELLELDTSVNRNANRHCAAPGLSL